MTKPSNFSSAYSDVLGGDVAVAITKLADGRAILKQAVRGATTAAITLATGLEAGDTIDGLTLVEGDRILVKDQADATENGIYAVEASGAPTRTLDADTGTELLGSYVTILAGTVNAGKLFRNTNTTAPTLGTDDVTFEEFAAGGVDRTFTFFGG
jgi:hypothetical protein